MPRYATAILVVLAVLIAIAIIFELMAWAAAKDLKDDTGRQYEELSKNTESQNPEIKTMISVIFAEFEEKLQNAREYDGEIMQQQEVEQRNAENRAKKDERQQKYNDIRAKYNIQQSRENTNDATRKALNTQTAAKPELYDEIKWFDRIKSVPLGKTFINRVFSKFIKSLLKDAIEDVKQIGMNSVDDVSKRELLYKINFNLVVVKFFIDSLLKNSKNHPIENVFGNKVTDDKDIKDLIRQLNLNLNNSGRVIGAFDSSGKPNNITVKAKNLASHVINDAQSIGQMVLDTSQQINQLKQSFGIND